MQPGLYIRLAKQQTGQLVGQPSGWLVEVFQTDDGPFYKWARLDSSEVYRLAGGETDNYLYLPVNQQ